MNFYLQQGYGMFGLNLEFSKKYNDLGVILAPRALQKTSKVNRLENHARELKKRGVKIFFDSQFYVPRTNIEKILKFPYFKSISFETVEFNIKYAKSFCRDVISYQINNINVDSIILPNRYINSVSKEWYELQEMFIEVANEGNYKKDIYLTLALGPDVVKNKEVFDELISKCINYNVDGYYFVLKSPNNQFLVNDEEYLYALMDGFISLKVAEKDIILGYANQQALIYSAVGVETIATGNFRNVRSFDPDIFVENDEEGVKRRGIWYYDGNSLSEYRPQQLSLAYRRGLDAYFGPKCEYCKNLLDSKNPANILWSEPLPFKHYLHEFRNQWFELKTLSSTNKVDFIIEKLEKIREHNNELERKGFNLGTRAFNEDIINACLGALIAIKHDRKYDLIQL